MTPPRVSLSKRALVCLLFGLLSAVVSEDTHASVSVEAKGFTKVVADAKTLRKLECGSTALSTTTDPPNASNVVGRAISANYFEIKNTDQSASITLTNQIDLTFSESTLGLDYIVLYVTPGGVPDVDGPTFHWTLIGSGPITQGSLGPTTITLSTSFTPLTIEPGQAYGVLVSSHYAYINYLDPAVPSQRQYGGTAANPLKITGFFGVNEAVLSPGTVYINYPPSPFDPPGTIKGRTVSDNTFAGTLHYTLDAIARVAIPTGNEEGDFRVTFDASRSTDLTNETRTFAFSVDGTEICAASATATCDYAGGLLNDGPSTAQVSVEVCYSCGTCKTASGTLTVANVAPRITADDIYVYKYLIKKGDKATITVDFIDPGAPDVTTLVIDWGDATTDTFNSVVSGWDFSHTYKKQGSFSVKLSLSDEDGGVTKVTASSPFVVKIPLYGLTAKGSITTPAAAIPHRSLRASDKAKFDVSVSTINGGSLPGGYPLTFTYTNIAFVATSYQSIIVDSTGKCAKVVGLGTMNGTGDFGFSAYACDLPTDTFHMKIWDKKNGDAIIYDNVPGIPDTDFSGTKLGSGSVAVTTNGV